MVNFLVLSLYDCLSRPLKTRPSMAADVTSVTAPGSIVLTQSVLLTCGLTKTLAPPRRLLWLSLTEALLTPRLPEQESSNAATVALDTAIFVARPPRKSLAI